MEGHIESSVREAPAFCKLNLGPFWNHTTGEATFSILTDSHIDAVEFWFFDNESATEPVSKFPGISTAVEHSKRRFTLHVKDKSIGPGTLYGVYPKSNGIDYSEFNWLVDPRALSITKAKWLNPKEGKTRPTKNDFITPMSVLIDRRVADLDSDLANTSFREDSLFRSCVEKARQSSLSSEVQNGINHRDWGALRIWELHVCDTRNFPLSGEELQMYGDWRGYYRFLCTPPFRRYLAEFDINAISLMPVNSWFDEWEYFPWTQNYWGYNPISLFALNPDLFYSTDHHEIILEMIVTNRLLKQSNVSVLIDSVYNHTCERGDFGPAVHHRILRPSVYLRDVNGNYVDRTNCQHTCVFDDPLLVDVEKHVLDFLGCGGFRLDTGAALSQKLDPSHGTYRFDREAMNAWQALKRSDALRIWEPAGFPYEYPHGKFPETDLEWVFPDWARDFLAGVARMFLDPCSTIGRLAYRLSGNSDYFNNDINRSVRFSSSHDGYNCFDWVEYMLAARLAEFNGISMIGLNWDQRQCALAEYFCLIRNAVEARDTSVVSQRLERQARDVFNLPDSDILTGMRQLFWSQVRALHTIVSMSPGAIMFSRGDLEGWSQDGSDNTHNHNKVITYAHSNDRVATRSYLKRMLRIRKELRVFETSKQLHESDVVWLAADGTPVVTGEKISEHGRTAAQIWDLQKNYLGVLYRRPIDDDEEASAYVFAAYYSGFLKSYDFRLPDIECRNDRNSARKLWCWELCVDSYLGIAGQASQDPESEFILGTRDVTAAHFAPGSTYACEASRVVVFRSAGRR